MTETLWESDADVRQTSHPDVLQVHERDQPIDVEQLRTEMARAATERDRHEIEAVLARWVETFAPPPDAGERRARGNVVTRR